MRDSKTLDLLNFVNGYHYVFHHYFVPYLLSDIDFLVLFRFLYYFFGFQLHAVNEAVCPLAFQCYTLHVVVLAIIFVRRCY